MSLPRLGASLTTGSGHTARSSKESLGAQGDRPATCYHWSPIQVKQHNPDETNFSLGTFVKTLSVDVYKEASREAKSELMRVESSNFRGRRLLCHLVGDTFVFCSGVAHGVCPGPSAPPDRMRLALLPEAMRPRATLYFPALMHDLHDKANLVTLAVAPDGWIRAASSREIEGKIHLSGIRFGLGRGMSLIDEVRVHILQTPSRRLAILQGYIGERSFPVHSRKALAMLPGTCKPHGTHHFVATGSSLGSYQLVTVQPSNGKVKGIGGELLWKDSVWIRDSINFSGVVFEVAPDAIVVDPEAARSAESAAIFKKDFQDFLVSKFGSSEAAWRQVFDTDGSGQINFTEFGLACKAVGYIGNVQRLWSLLDDEDSGEISYKELTGEELPELMTKAESPFKIKVPLSTARFAAHGRAAGPAKAIM